jgi:hypothetical protein
MESLNKGLNMFSITRNATPKNPVSPISKKLKLSALDIHKQMFLYGLNKGNVTVSKDVEKNELRVSVSDKLPLIYESLPEYVAGEHSGLFAAVHNSYSPSPFITTNIPSLGSLLYNHILTINDGSRHDNSFYDIVLALIGNSFDGQQTSSIAGVFNAPDAVYVGIFGIIDGDESCRRIANAMDTAANYINSVS